MDEVASAAAPPASCPVSPVRQIRPGIAPGIGSDGVWMISGQVMPSPGADTPMKTVWLVDECLIGEVKITGERADGSGVATFAYDVNLGSVGPGATLDAVNEVSQRNRELLLRQRQTAVTFGPPHGIRNDRRGYVFYPGPGCWRFTAATEQGSFDIFQYLYPRSNR